MHKIIIYPEGKEISFLYEENLLKVLQDEGVNINSICGGEGWCGKCKVVIKEGNPSPLTETERRLLISEEIEKGIRLACQVIVRDNLKIEIVDKSEDIKILYKFNLTSNIKLDPVVSLESFSLPLPSLEDQTSDLERILRGVRKRLTIKKIDLVRKIPKFLRENNFQGKLVIFENEIIDVREENFSNPLGIAFDIGTTTLVGYLLNLKEGKELEVVSEINPQNKFGSDVISRINYVMNSKDGIKILRKSLLSSLKEIIEKLCRKHNCSPLDIYAISITGNPTMTHLFLGITPEYIAISPYPPVITSGMIFDAKDLDFEISLNAKIYVLPQISGYVGGDIVGGILATNLWKEEGNILLVDVGTNGEIVLKTQDGIFSCATAAGPAFEGGHITYGMIAGEGAIDHVWIEDGEVVFSVIGDRKEEGICGSGLIDAISVMLDLGVIDETGRFKKNEFFSLGSIKITQKDVREIQLAKSAIRSGIEILLKEVRKSFKDIDKIYLAGAFGSYMRRESAIKIGLLPPVNVEKVNLVGNSAGKGAELVLLNKEYIKISEKISKEINYIELSARKDFQDYFVEFMHF